MKKYGRLGLFYIIVIVIVLCFSCPGNQDKSRDDSLNQLDSAQADQPDTQVSVSKEKSLLERLYLAGIKKAAVAVRGDELVVNYQQPPVESDLDTIIAWQSIAEAALNVFPQKTSMVIKMFNSQEALVQITIPLAAIQDFADGKIDADQYQAQFVLEGLFKAPVLTDEKLAFFNSPGSGEPAEPLDADGLLPEDDEETDYHNITAGNQWTEVIIRKELTIFIFYCTETGTYRFTHRENAELPLFLMANDGEMNSLGDNVDETNDSYFLPSLSFECIVDQAYVLIVSPINDEDYEKTAGFQLVRE